MGSEMCIRDRLLNDNHNKFWNIAKDELKKVMGDDRDFQPTSDKIDNFKHSHGTILYFEDQEVIEGLQNLSLIHI